MRSSSQILEQSRQTPLATTPMLAGLLVALAGLGSLPLLGLHVPLWIQPSFVGLLWGGLFLSGCWLTFAGHTTWLNLALVLLGSVLLSLEFHAITDLTSEESMLTSVALVTCGWMAMRFDSSPKNTIAGQSVSSNRRQIPLIDFFVVTTLVACVIRAITHMASPPIMLIGVLGTLVVGCSCCWAAYHWAWNDARPIGIPAIITVLSMLSLAVVYQASPLSGMELAVWIIQGPLSVVAAQCFTVLAVLASVRWRMRVSATCIVVERAAVQRS
jgi:hypothetical protein